MQRRVSMQHLLQQQCYPKRQQLSDGQRDLERLIHYLASLLRDSVKCCCIQKVRHLLPCRIRQAQSSRLTLTEQSQGRGKERGERERYLRHVASELAMMLFKKQHPPQSEADC
ncbi:hypothetical protein AMECASPLE_029304 [Ameca splendens]|uniref:Uncharacterized protein n=1 Tax=Ameca splendens TaxID=208324 RepID=A0ABV1A166_9TELE